MPLSVFLSFALKTQHLPADDLLGMEGKEREERNTDSFYHLLWTSEPINIENSRRGHQTRTYPPNHSHLYPLLSPSIPGHREPGFPPVWSCAFLGFTIFPLYPYLNHVHFLSPQMCSSPLHPKDGRFLLFAFHYNWISKTYCLHTLYLSPIAICFLLTLLSLKLVRIMYLLLATSYKPLFDNYYNLPFCCCDYFHTDASNHLSFHWLHNGFFFSCYFQLLFFSFHCQLFFFNDSLNIGPSRKSILTFLWFEFLHL